MGKSRRNKARKSTDHKPSTTEATVSYSAYPSATLWRRLIAMVYDQLVLWAIWIATGFVHALVFGIDSTDKPQQLSTTLFPMLLLVTFLFYYWFWTHGGQTLGMRAWRLKVVDARLDGTPPHFVRCLLRFIGAFLSLSVFGLGYIWVLFDPNRDTWHDRLSNTRTLVIPKEENKKNRFSDSRRIPRDPV